MDKNITEKRINKITNLCKKWNVRYAEYYKSLTGVAPSSQLMLVKTSFQNYFALDFVNGSRIWFGNLNEILRYVSIMLRTFNVIESHDYILYSPQRYMNKTMRRD